MPDFELRHRIGPSPDFRESGRHADSQQRAELVAYSGDTLVVAEAHHLAAHLATDECARQDCAGGCASFELEAGKTPRDYSPMLECWHDEAECARRPIEIA